LNSAQAIPPKDVEDWAEKDAKIPKRKQHKGYSNFIEGYIHDVEGTFTCSFIALFLTKMMYYLKFYFPLAVKPSHNGCQV